MKTLLALIPAESVAPASTCKRSVTPQQHNLKFCIDTTPASHHYSIAPLRSVTSTKMSDDGDPDGIAGHLASLQLSVKEELEAATRKASSLLNDGAEKYEQLLAKYNALRKTVEARNAVDSGNGASHEYVLVLVDTHSHKFDADKIYCCNSRAAGESARYMLHSQVWDYIEECRPELVTSTCFLRTLVFTDLDQLSTESITPDDTGAANVRMVRDFARGFSDSFPWTYWVDTGHTHSVRDKILFSFADHVQDPQCKHIFLGASGHEKYFEMLQQNEPAFSKITLIEGSFPDPAIDALGLATTRFMFVAPPKQSVASGGILSPVDSCGPISPPRTRTSHPRGHFKNSRYIKYDRAKDTTETLTSIASSDTILSTSSRKLPTEARPGLIPINAGGYRLDTISSPPSKSDWDLYQARIKHRKLCNAFHLRGSCNDARCEFDHSAISPDILKCLQFLLMEWPCRQKGDCRRSDCYNGHVCQKGACRRRKFTTCNFPHNAHKVDWQVAKWIKPGEDVAAKAEAKSAQIADRNSSKGSMENWPAMVGNLIDI
ncbi:hypothetical protein EK21DRAFT_106053 [Setomelanomma holmii]|uniref:C3H1-type domain-containing protein n=1 Tax=Setomelanomma holmii TaxID=210430 RepID=A0A9P4LUF1_9PLEO|nr:hypothetical protein EK21DRAFT_106053 [Setomelanomma holmii]